jgi:hypothetical protein
MKILALAFILFIFIILLIIVAISQIQMAGINIKDFWGFIDANQNLDKLYKFAKRYEKMSSQEQIIYLAEAEKMFDAFDKIPETVWEEEHSKYSEVLSTYQNIRVMRWNEAQEYEKSKKLNKKKNKKTTKIVPKDYKINPNN